MFTVLLLSTFSANQEEKMSLQPRVLENLRIARDDLANLLKEFDLTLNGTAVTPKEGRIATNLVVPTQELGNVMVRMYPLEAAEKLETGNFDFELEVLEFLKPFELSVPKPLKTVLTRDGRKVFLYPLLPGISISQNELSVNVAKLAGEFLSKMIIISESMRPKLGDRFPSGDLDYIGEIYRKRMAQIPQIAEHQVFQEMIDLVNSPQLRLRLERTPKGFVHADFFFENLLFNPANETVSLIDFGDSYYGHVVMDTAIGGMEFSVLESGEWQFDFLREFLRPNMPWFLKNQIDGGFYLDLVRVNCLRFAVYTLPFTLKDKHPVEENSYVRRFIQLGQTETKERFLYTFESAKT